MRFIIILIVTVLIGFSAEAQKRIRGRDRVVVVKHSRYRPKRVVVYHPAWHPKWECHRRWVFFPRYNLYWDNWRNHYVFYSGKSWVSQSAPPKSVENVNLANEKHYELDEADDDVDDIGSMNQQHKEKHKE